MDLYEFVVVIDVSGFVEFFVSVVYVVEVNIFEFYYNDFFDCLLIV